MYHGADITRDKTELRQILDEYDDLQLRNHAALLLKRIRGNQARRPHATLDDPYGPDERLAPIRREQHPLHSICHPEWPPSAVERERIR